MFPTTSVLQRDEQSDRQGPRRSSYGIYSLKYPKARLVRSGPAHVTGDSEGCEQGERPVSTGCSHMMGRRVSRVFEDRQVSYQQLLISHEPDNAMWILGDSQEPHLSVEHLSFAQRDICAGSPEV